MYVFIWETKIVILTYGNNIKLHGWYGSNVVQYDMRHLPKTAPKDMFSV